MILNANYEAVMDFLKFRREVLRREDNTLHADWGELRYFLEWAQETPFPESQKKRPVFPVFMETAKPLAGYKTGELGAKFMKRCTDKARLFLNWARDTLPAYRRITKEWILTIQDPKVNRPPKERESVKLEEIMQLLAVPENGHTSIMRDKAAAAFLFLSGMRVQAFVTLPMKAVDLERRRILQRPDFGVMTKKSKRATTTLLDLPELMVAVQRWDDFIRANLPDEAAWYAPLTDAGTPLAKDVLTIGKKHGRATQLRQGLQHLYTLAGLKYHAPHKHRHGHAEYVIGRAADIGDLKALSQNLMHANIGITDGIYAILSTDDMQSRIANLGKRQSGDSAPAAPMQDIAAIVAETLKRMGVVTVPAPAASDQSAPIDKPKPPAPKRRGKGKA